MDEKESAYRKKNPKMDKKELSRLMLQDFNSLPAKEKVTDTSRHVTSHMHFTFFTMCAKHLTTVHHLT